MFCSLECRRETLKNFHDFECPLMEQLLNSTLTSTMRIAMRIFFMALSFFEGNIDNFEKSFQNLKTRTVYDVESHQDFIENLSVVNSLSFNSKVEVDENLFEAVFSNCPKLAKMWSSHQSFIRNFLKKLTQLGTMNYHEIHNWPLKKGGLPDELEEVKESLAYKREVKPVGSGSYPFIALINHHCAPNVNRIFVYDKNVLIVQRPIAKGEQLFDNYGYPFTNTPLEYRQTELLQRYKFRCNCEACANKWPLMPNLKIKDKTCFNKAKKACRELKLGGMNQKRAKEQFNELCKVVEINKNNFPSLEICNIMDSSFAYLELILKPVVQFQ